MWRLVLFKIVLPVLINLPHVLGYRTERHEGRTKAFEATKALKQIYDRSKYGDMDHGQKRERLLET